MFGIGIGEFMLIMVVALLVVGPDKLPGIARTLAKTYNEFRRAGNDIKKSVREINVDSAEELIMGTVNRIVPGKADKNGPGRADKEAPKKRADWDTPGKGSGAHGAQGSREKSTAETAQEELLERAAEPDKETSTEVTGGAEESNPAPNPVDFEEPRKAASSKNAALKNATVKGTTVTPEAPEPIESDVPKKDSVKKSRTQSATSQKTIEAAKGTRKKSVSKRPSKAGSASSGTKGGGKGKAAT